MLPAGDHMRTKAKPVILPARVYSPNAAVTGVAQRRYLVLSAAIRLRNDFRLPRRTSTRALCGKLRKPPATGVEDARLDDSPSGRQFARGT
jgi:hypothetical protein